MMFCYRYWNHGDSCNGKRVENDGSLKTLFADATPFFHVDEYWSVFSSVMFSLVQFSSVKIRRQISKK